MHTSRARPAGFTLVETLVTVCLAGVLLAVALPSVHSVGMSMKLAGFANALLSHMHFARSEAIKRNAPVVVCKSSDGTSCSTRGGWEQGWIVFHDASRNGSREPPEQLLQRLDALPAGFRFRGNLNVERYVSFSPTGSTRTAAGAFQAGTLTVCRVSAEATQGRQVVINAVGRPRIQKVDLASCR